MANYREAYYDEVDGLLTRLKPSPFNVPLEDPVPHEDFRVISPAGWVSNADASTGDATVTIDTAGITILGGKISVQDSGGVTTISGGIIRSAGIEALAITTDKLAANAVTAAKIAAGTITANEIAANTITAAKIAADTITANEIAASAITTSELAADSVTTPKILAGNVTSSRIELTVSGKNFGANSGEATAPGVYFDSASTTGMYLAVGGDIGFSVGGAVGFVMGEAGNNQSQWALTPRQDNVVSSGASGKRWTAVWAANGTIQTSDAREKQDIADEPLGLNFVRLLRPRVYRWRDTPDTQAQESASIDQAALERDCEPYVREIERIRAAQVAGNITDNYADQEVVKLRAKIAMAREKHMRPVMDAQAKRRTGRRLHHGLIAQEVKQALDSVRADTVDAAFWQSDPEGRQSLVYTELIAPIIRAVQELDARLLSLEKPDDDSRGSKVDAAS